MNARFPGAQARFVVVLAIALLLALAAVFASELISRYRWAHETLETIEPRYARVKGLQQIGDDIRTRRVEMDIALERVAHSADVEIGRIGTELQQRIRRIADELEIRVSGSQILPAREENGFVVVTVSGTMDGDTDALGAFLVGLSDENPPIIVEKLLAQAPRPGRRGEVSGRVTFQANMSVLRLLP